VLLGPQGRWRDDLWFEDLLAARAGAGDADGPAGRKADRRPTLTGPLPVNTCSEDSLTLLPGVGPKLAQRIVASRRTEGPFRAAADLQRVKGIGPVLAGRLAPLVVFTPAKTREPSAGGKSP